LVNRKSNSPWGSSYKEGLPSTAVNDTVNIDQNVRATINTGVIDVATGQWEGNRLSDKQFTIDAIHEAVANGAAVLSPQAQPNRIDMTGYQDLLIAIKPSRGGNLATTAVMGPNTNYFANLDPVDAASVLRGASLPQNSTADLQPLFEDAAQDAPVDVWSIYILQGVVAGQKNLQFKITNNSGGNSNIQFAYMRLI
jgi:hypothetical protein